METQQPTYPSPGISEALHYEVRMELTPWKQACQIPAVADLGLQQWSAKGDCMYGQLAPTSFRTFSDALRTCGQNIQFEFILRLPGGVASRDFSESLDWLRGPRPQ